MSKYIFTENVDTLLKLSSTLSKHSKILLSKYPDLKILKFPQKYYLTSDNIMCDDDVIVDVFEDERIRPAGLDVLIYKQIQVSETDSMNVYQLFHNRHDNGDEDVVIRVASYEYEFTKHDGDAVYTSYFDKHFLSYQLSDNCVKLIYDRIVEFLIKHHNDEEFEIYLDSFPEEVVNKFESLKLFG